MLVARYRLDLVEKQDVMRGDTFHEQIMCVSQRFELISAALGCCAVSVHDNVFCNRIFLARSSSCWQQPMRVKVRQTESGSLIYYKDRPSALLDSTRLMLFKSGASHVGCLCSILVSQTGFNLASVPASCL